VSPVTGLSVRSMASRRGIGRAGRVAGSLGKRRRHGRGAVLVTAAELAGLTTPPTEQPQQKAVPLASRPQVWACSAASATNAMEVERRGRGSVCRGRADTELAVSACAPTDNAALAQLSRVPLAQGHG
jgi:hypothetical protein